MNESNNINRRQFMSRSAAAAVGVGLSTVAGPAINVLGANEKLRVGIIGPGGRGSSLLERAHKVPNVEFIAVADTYEGWRNRAIKRVDKWTGKKPKGYPNFREMLDKKHKDLDAVIIATPEHAHAHQIIACCEAGLDVYTEKPMTKTWQDAVDVVKAVKLNRRIVQVGTQRRSNEIYYKARDIIASGRIGPVHQVRAMWYRNSKDNDPQWRYRIPKKANEANIDWEEFLGSAPYVPFSTNRYFQWRCYWDYSNGIAGDLMFHQVDAINLVMNSSFPTGVMAAGDIYRFKELGRTTSDNWNAIIEYPDFVLNYNCYFSSAHYGLWEQFLGSDATLAIEGARKIYIYPEDERHRMQEVTSEEIEKPDVDDTVEHLRNFFECVRSRKPTNATVDYGSFAAATAYMSVLSNFKEKKIKWDPVRRTVVA